MNCIQKRLRLPFRHRALRYLSIAGAVLGLHYLMLVMACIVIHGGFSFGQFAAMFHERLMTVGDAPRYLDIAMNGYVAQGENARNLVFFPLYPLLIRLLGFVSGNLEAAGIMISQLCYAGASILLYDLILMDGDQEAAWSGVLLMALYPFSMFAMGIFTEGLFLFLTIGCLYAIRKGRFLAAGVLGFFAALTRNQGMLLIFPAVYEIIVRRFGREKRPVRPGDWAVLLIPGGFCVYLLINLFLHGNALQFLIFEAEEPWFQSTQWVGRNIAMHYRSIIAFQGLDLVIYWPQIVLYFGALILLFYGIWKKERTSLLLYSGAYLGFTYLSGWMISGGRYMLSCVPLFILLGKMKPGTGKRFLFLIFAFLFFAYSLFYLHGFAIM